MSEFQDSKLYIPLPPKMARALDLGRHLSGWRESERFLLDKGNNLKFRREFDRVRREIYFIKTQLDDLYTDPEVIQSLQDPSLFRKSEP